MSRRSLAGIALAALILGPLLVATCDGPDWLGPFGALVLPLVAGASAGYAVAQSVRTGPVTAGLLAGIAVVAVGVFAGISAFGLACAR